MKKNVLSTLLSIVTLAIALPAAASTPVFGPGNYGTYNPWAVDGFDTSYGGGGTQVGAWSFGSASAVNTGNAALNAYLNNFVDSILNGAGTPRVGTQGDSLIFPAGVLNAITTPVRHVAILNTALFDNPATAAPFDNPLSLSAGAYTLSFAINEDVILSALSNFSVSIYGQAGGPALASIASPTLLALLASGQTEYQLAFNLASQQSVSIVFDATVGVGVGANLVVSDIAISKNSGS